MGEISRQVVPYPTKADGRPARLKYDPAYCNVVRELAQQGKFPETWCAHIGICRATLYNWSNAYPEFEEAVRIAWHLLAHYWTEKAAEMVDNAEKRGQTTLLEMLRKRFPSIWGGQASFTLEAFEARNDPAPTPGEGTKPPVPITEATRDELLQRIAELEARRATGSKA